MQEKISYDSLQHLYETAMEVCRLEPWSVMEEDENFAVKAGPDGETFFASVIGSAGISRGLIFYRGAKGWNTFKRIREGILKAEDAIHEIDSLALDFDPWSEIDPEARKRLKRLGYGPGKGLLPSPRVYKPGRMPSLPDASDSETLTRLIRAALPVFHRSLREPEWLLGGPGHTLFNVQAGADQEIPEGEWLAPPELPAPETGVAPPDELMLARLKGKSFRTCPPWEIHMGDAGAAVGDAEGAFFPLVAIFADSTTGIIVGFALAPALEMPSLLPQECLKAMKTHGSRPEAIHVKKEEIVTWLGPVTEKLGIPVVLKKQLPRAQEAQRELQGFMRKR
jgi:hypothetical protein